MKVYVPKVKTNIRQISFALSKLGKIVVSNKTAQSIIVTVPAFGWIGSEIHRGIDNKKHQKQVALYQKLLCKHQAEIDILKNDKEREEYKQKLWDTLVVKAVEV